MSAKKKILVFFSRPKEHNFSPSSITFVVLCSLFCQYPHCIFIYLSNLMSYLFSYKVRIRLKALLNPRRGIYFCFTLISIKVSASLKVNLVSNVCLVRKCNFQFESQTFNKAEFLNTVGTQLPWPLSEIPYCCLSGKSLVLWHYWFWSSQKLIIHM